mmetsp:Transcript_27514/g.56399  ORF Transcript_27514/g.56399 Transcript_27514/m.56399 type:complete len:139 (-) Transcript_27514:353-769(-)
MRPSRNSVFASVHFSPSNSNAIPLLFHFRFHHRSALERSRSVEKAAEWDERRILVSLSASASASLEEAVSVIDGGFFRGDHAVPHHSPGGVTNRTLAQCRFAGSAWRAERLNSICTATINGLPRQVTAITPEAQPQLE